MSFTNKKFYDLNTGKVVQIKDHFDDIAILNDNSKVRMTRLLDKNYYDEYIDPSDFLKNESLLSNFAQKIKQIPDSSVQSMNFDQPNYYEQPSNNNQNRPIDFNNLPGVGSLKPTMNESAVIQYDQEEEKMELLRKAQNMYGSATVNMDSFKNLIDEGDLNMPVVQPFRPQQQNQVSPNQVQKPQEEQIQRIEVVRDDETGDVVHDEPDFKQESTSEKVFVRDVPQPKAQIIQEDPIIQMFKNVKRNSNFKLEFTIENKIPRPDFIEMMEDSYNSSIIDFLADEFTQKILSNPDFIKDKIKEEINRIVYKPVPEKKERILPNVPIEDTEVLNEGVERPKRKRNKVVPQLPNPPEDRILVEGKEPKAPRSKK